MLKPGGSSSSDVLLCCMSGGQCFLAGAMLECDSLCGMQEAQSSIGLAEQSVPESPSLEFNVQIIHDIREVSSSRLL